MFRLLRTFIVCTLVLALPVQGWATAVMAFCGPDSGPVSASVAADPGHHGHAAPPDVDSDSTANPAGHSCSACAACSAGALMPTPLLRLPAHEPAADLIAWAAIHMLVHVGSGLERPPRNPTT